MTKEELEKEAREYAEGMAMYYESAHGSIPSQFEKYLRKAVEYGYNKAMKETWHYPSNGEYPKEHQLVLGIFQKSEYYTPTELVYYSKELDCWSNQMGDSEYHNIVAWKEIVLPKEKE